MALQYEDAMALLIRWLRKPDHGNFGSFGYDIYLPAIVRTYLRKEKGLQSDYDNAAPMREIMPMLYAAAWDLCRRGILRPGIYEYGAQATDDGNAGNGYSYTPFGEKWLAENEKEDFIPTEPERFAQLFTAYRDIFGDAYFERTQEAVKCYSALAYLACCAMCGAAAESIIVATASNKSSIDEILKLYFSANGRSKVENIIIGKAKMPIQDGFKSYMGLLKYWRDSAAHGAASHISDNEAYTSLLLLLRFSIFVKDNWGELVGA
jgi:hypothetical protein